MRILAIHLKNYRVHRDLLVNFDPHRTLVGGPNESGKSTLAEALHRALFMRAKGNTEMHRAMRSATFPGTPEIVLRFECEGRPYTLTKFFSTNGSTTLEGDDFRTLRDTEAEDSLARILKTDTGLNAKKSLESHWSHAWAWQGSASADPSELSKTIAPSLVQRLQTEGAGAILKSSLDQKLADHFRGVLKKSVGNNSKPLSSSPIALSLSALENASQRLLSARNRFHNLQHALSDFHAATEALTKLTIEEGILRHDENNYHRRSEELSVLRQKKASLEGECNAEKLKLDRLNQAHSEIARLETEIAAAEKDLGPRKIDLERLEKGSKQAQSLAENSLSDHRRFIDESRQLGRRHQLSEAHEKLLLVGEELLRLSKTREQIHGVQKRVRDTEQALRNLPGITQKRVDELHRISGQLHETTAALRAMGVRLELLESSGPVSAGGELLVKNTPITLLESLELSIGLHLRLLVSPGMGLGIADMRLKEARLTKDLAAALEASGVTSVQEARQIFERRAMLESEKKANESELRGLDPETVETALTRAEDDAREASKSVERLTPDCSGFLPPTGKEAARELRLNLYSAAQQLEESVKQADAACVEAEKARKDALEELEQHKNLFQIDSADLSSKKNQLHNQIQQTGAPAQRIRAIVNQESVCARLESELSANIRSVEALHPDQMAQELARINRSRDGLRASVIEWNGRKTAAEALLKLDGSNDPKEELARAEADFLLCEENTKVQTRKLNATRMLSRFFEEAQEELNAHFTRPLQEKVESYLRCVFGPTAHTPFQFSDQGLSDITLVRTENGGTPFDFEFLSAGAREQTATAFRLALAEVLAPELGGTLPVVLDDAFANSDPERVRLINRMLDLAASKGLQVILLSCTPEDYSGLGAKTVILERPLLRAVSSLAPVASFPTVPSEVEDSADCEAFLTALKELGGSAGNGSLRQRLCWDDERYTRVKDQLLAASGIMPGRGRGGSVALVDF